MNDFILSCESTVDLPYEYVKERNIKVIPYTYLLDDKVYTDSMSEDSHQLPEFYNKLKEGKLVSTTLINEQRYKDYFMRLLEQSDHVLHIVFGSGLSGSIEYAIKAAKAINSSYTNKHIEVIDSISGSAGYGIIVDKAADLRDEGKTVKEIVDWIKNYRLKIHHYIFVTNLSYLKRGGRISSTEATVGNILSIIPLIYMDKKGELKVFSKARGKKNVIRKMLSLMEENTLNGCDYSDKCFISHSNCYEYASTLRDAVEERFKNLKGQVKISNVGPVIGSHTGQGAVGVFFIGRERASYEKYE